MRQSCIAKKNTGIRRLLRKVTNSYDTVVVRISTMIVLRFAGKLTPLSRQRFSAVGWHHSSTVPKFDMDQNIF
jgi:hypothetical protein